MTWNHRIVRFKAPDDIFNDFYAICEVFYDESGNPNAHTADGVKVGGYSIEEIRQQLQWMIECLDYPILDEMK